MNNTNNTKRRRGRRTAEEHEAWMRETGKWDELMEMRRKQDEEIERHRQAMRKEEDPLIRDLQAAGYQVESVWDLVNTSVPYPSALPILLQHLQRPYRPEIREGIARAMAVPDARFAWDMFVKLYKEEENSKVKDGMAAAIAAIADDSLLDDVIALLKDRRHGSNRVILVMALEKSKTLKAYNALHELQSDPGLAAQISESLRRISRRKRPPKP